MSSPFKIRPTYMREREREMQEYSYNNNPCFPKYAIVENYQSKVFRIVIYYAYFCLSPELRGTHPVRIEVTCKYLLNKLSIAPHEAPL